jgi:GNAT superfamily N-acetyltransferase
VTVDADLLARFDGERRALGVPSLDGRVVREMSADGSECRIVYTDCPQAELDALISAEQARAATAGYSLEWKTYGHDAPGLPDRLLAAGFEADDEERVLVLPLTDERIAAFGGSAHEVRRMHDATGLADYAEISREIGRTGVEEETARLATALADDATELSVHVAYVDGIPAACGRLYLRTDSPFAELAGGRTKTTHRRLGLFTALVAARLREARDRGRTHVLVDALPTSEPILTKRGFQLVTTTTPYVHDPRRIQCDTSADG